MNSYAALPTNSDDWLEDARKAMTEFYDLIMVRCSPLDYGETPTEHRLGIRRAHTGSQREDRRDGSQHSELSQNASRSSFSGGRHQQRRYTQLQYQAI